MIDWNVNFSSASNLYPPVRVEVMNKGSLACSHTNMMLRCIEAGMVSPLTSQLFTYGEDDKLRQAATVGHHWWVLSDQCPLEDQKLISEWRNADNGQTQFKHEVEMMKSIAEICRAEFRLAETVAGEKNMFSAILRCIF